MPSLPLNTNGLLNFFFKNSCWFGPQIVLIDRIMTHFNWQVHSISLLWPFSLLSLYRVSSEIFDKSARVNINFLKAWQIARARWASCLSFVGCFFLWFSVKLWITTSSLSLHLSGFSFRRFAFATYLKLIQFSTLISTSCTQLPLSALFGLI